MAIDDAHHFANATVTTHNTSVSNLRKVQKLRSDASSALQPAVRPGQALALCHMRNNHYILMHVNHANRSITHYDSMSNREIADSDMLNMNNILRDGSGKQFTPYSTQHGSAVQQLDSVSCGLHALVNFDALLGGKLPPTKIAATNGEVREKLARARRHYFKMMFDPTHLLNVIRKVKRNRPDLVSDEWLSMFTDQSILRAADRSQF